MTPADLDDFRSRMGWTRRQLGEELGTVSQDRLRRWMSGQVPIPRYIELACAELERGAKKRRRAR